LGIGARSETAVDSGDFRTRFWAVHCAVFMGCFATFSLYHWRYLGGWRADNWVLTLGDVSSASVGAALVIAITTEVGIAMVLFAPKMIEKFRAQGAEEGLRQGVEIGVEIGVKQEREKWQAWQQRVDAWYQRLQDAQANGQPR
jgi:hypothetical protein